MALQASASAASTTPSNASALTSRLRPRRVSPAALRHTALPRTARRADTKHTQTQAAWILEQLRWIPLTTADLRDRRHLRTFQAPSQGIRASKLKRWTLMRPTRRCKACITAPWTRITQWRTTLGLHIK
ncbi:hypothetical protein HWV62_2663 [Athelia sp. TMB]|nr:hypothetical protein HWV62_2663 [Athelia sp. TMB]